MTIYSMVDEKPMTRLHYVWFVKKKGTKTTLVVGGAVMTFFLETQQTIGHSIGKSSFWGTSLCIV